MNDVFEKIEPALSLALDTARSKEGLKEARNALLACQACLELYRPAEPRGYDPARIVEERLGSSLGERRLLETENVPECTGDSAQVMECVLLLLDAVELDADAAIVVEVLSEKDIPRVQLNLDGPGRFPDPLYLGGVIELTLERLGERWTAATRGGRIDRTPNGFDMRLKGVRVIPEPVEGLDALVVSVREAEQRVHLMVDPPDGGPVNSIEETLPAAREAIQRALALVDGDASTKEPSEIGAALSEGVQRHRDALERRAIAVESLCEPGLPPIAVLRKRIISFFANALRHAGQMLSRGGSVSILVDYDNAQRQLEAIVTFVGTQYEHRETAYFASMRRTATDLHCGTFEASADKLGITVTATFPDPVGRALDEWIPGFDAFGVQSRQMLRLLKSGGPAPPEDLILGGVLETELERWLLPKLSQPVAVNLAHELKPDNRDLPGSSKERLAKALGQIKRGKPRKEIVKPGHAAEILWAFRVDERHRPAVGAERLGVEEIEGFCRGLLSGTPDYSACLRLVARALGGVDD